MRDIWNRKEKGQQSTNTASYTGDKEIERRRQKRKEKDKAERETDEKNTPAEIRGQNREMKVRWRESVDWSACTYAHVLLTPAVIHSCCFARARMYVCARHASQLQVHCRRFLPRGRRWCQLRCFGDVTTSECAWMRVSALNAPRRAIRSRMQRATPVHLSAQVDCRAAPTNHAIIYLFAFVICSDARVVSLSM